MYEQTYKTALRFSLQSPKGRRYVSRHGLHGCDHLRTFASRLKRKQFCGETGCCSLLLHRKQRIYEFICIEFLQVIDVFTDPDIFYGDPQF